MSAITISSNDNDIKLSESKSTITTETGIK